MLMRWMLIGLLISVFALLVLAGCAVRHILRQRRLQSEKAPDGERDLTLDLPEAPESPEV